VEIDWFYSVAYDSVALSYFLYTSGCAHQDPATTGGQHAIEGLDDNIAAAYLLILSNIIFSLAVPVT
jgi:hypothetical protein